MANQNRVAGVPIFGLFEQRFQFSGRPSMNRLSIRRGIYQNSSIGSIVRELHVDAEIVAAQQRDYLLQRVAIFAGDAHHVALDGSLHFLFAVFDQFHDLPGFFGGDALLQRDFLANAGAGGGMIGP